MRCAIDAAGNEDRGRVVRAGVLIASALYVVGVCLYLSHRRMLWFDEMMAWNLLTDPSWHHMVESWKAGADSGGLFFYAIGRMILRLGGAHPLAIRMVFALGLWLSAVLWWSMMRRRFSSLWSAFAVSLVFLCNGVFVNYLAEVRFYSLLIITVTLAAYVASWIEETRPSPGVAFGLCLIAHAFLVSTHLLGVGYSLAIVLAVAASRIPLRQRLAGIAGAVCSWPLLLLYRSQTHSGAGKLSWIPMPHPMALTRYYFHNPSPLRFVNAVLWLLILYAAYVGWKDRKSAVPQERRFGTILTGLLLLVPVGFYVVSHAAMPLFAERYMMPYNLGFLYLLGWALTKLASVPGGLLARYRMAAVAVGAVCLIVLHVATMRSEPLRPHADIAGLLALDAPVPVVIPAHYVFVEVEHERDKARSHLVYVMPKTISAGDDPDHLVSDGDVLTTINSQGYDPDIYGEAAFLAANLTFWFVDLPEARGVLLRSLIEDGGLVASDAGTVMVKGAPVRLLAVRRR